jgi:ParB family chromosome partitioning protein
MAAITVSPFRCRVWSLHSRLDESLTEESCKAEIESFEKHGQLIPALGRRLRGDREYDVELIYGARRLFVCRLLSQPLLVELRDVSDRDGIIAMDLENRLRKDVSAYERALSYARWLREGHFKSASELAGALHVSHAQVSRLLKMARLPPAVVGAFESPTEICEAWGERLGRLLEHSNTESRVLGAARVIAAVVPRLPAQDVYERLCAAAKLPRTRAGQRIVKDVDGKELFRVRHRRGLVMFNVPLDVLSQGLLDEIERAIAVVADPGLADALVAVPVLGPIPVSADSRDWFAIESSTSRGAGVTTIPGISVSSGAGSELTKIVLPIAVR